MYRYPTSITLLEIYLVVLDVLGQPEVVEFRLTRVPVRLDKYLSDPSQGFQVGIRGQEIHLKLAGDMLNDVRKCNSG
jgi:hypothetical protein